MGRYYMSLLFLCGSRGEWGYIRPIIDICRKKNIKYGICLTNMVLLENHGNLSKEIKDNKYNVIDEIEMALEGNTHYSMAKSLSLFGLSFNETLKREKPSWLILAGDRGEQLMGAINAAYTYTPVAHIQAGERSGNIDGTARHAITRFAHIHFAANKDAYNRLLRNGEEKFRIFNVGAPQLDEIKNNKITNFKKFKNKHKLENIKKYFLVVFHSVTEEFLKTKKNTHNLIEALGKFKQNKIWILPNNDAGSSFVKNKILENREVGTYIFNNFSREDYLSLLKNSELIVGNSSSGILEAPSFKKITINIGKRQNNRMQAISTINSNNKTEDIIKKIKIGLSKKFKERIKKVKNPYGKGNSSQKIIDILNKTKITDKLIVKKITY
tara:strand:+ start:790 stop:1938 length:1149 start_codon:yes stop_codon:yes gene_type:complete